MKCVRRIEDGVKQEGKARRTGTRIAGSGASNDVAKPTMINEIALASHKLQTKNTKSKLIKSKMV
jgi:hypothetical protein